jgi:hypothetical protein
MITKVVYYSTVGVNLKQAAVDRKRRVSLPQQDNVLSIRCRAQLFEYCPSISIQERDSCAQLTCTAPIDEGDVLITVPESSWLDSSVAARVVGKDAAGAGKQI